VFEGRWAWVGVADRPRCSGGRRVPRSGRWGGCRYATMRGSTSGRRPEPGCDWRRYWTRRCPGAASSPGCPPRSGTTRTAVEPVAALKMARSLIFRRMGLDQGSVQADHHDRPAMLTPTPARIRSPPATFTAGSCPCRATICPHALARAAARTLARRRAGSSSSFNRPATSSRIRKSVESEASPSGPKISTCEVVASMSLSDRWPRRLGRPPHPSAHGPGPGPGGTPPAPVRPTGPW
jgi:hypothetical protein